MSSLYKKVISGRPYYYLREMGRVDVKPTMVSERWPTSSPCGPCRSGNDATTVRENILDTLGGIEETIMIYPSGGRPKARRLTTTMTADQQALYDLFTLHRWAPATT